MAFRTPAFGILVRVKVWHSTKLGSDEDRLGSLLQKASDQALAATISVDVSRIKECHPRLDGSGEDSERLLVRNISPIGAAELPTTQTNFRNFYTSFVKRPLFHVLK